MVDDTVCRTHILFCSSSNANASRETQQPKTLNVIIYIFLLFFVTYPQFLSESQCTTVFAP
ncbi:MAG: hypothetical protein NC401_14925, partial [Ruminococcus sp.]|nr:hypothetical protein [Ruminococcus sp.]